MTKTDKTAFTTKRVGDNLELTFSDGTTQTISPGEHALPKVGSHISWDPATGNVSVWKDTITILPE